MLKDGNRNIYNEMTPNSQEKCQNKDNNINNNIDESPIKDSKKSWYNENKAHDNQNQNIELQEFVSPVKVFQNPNDLKDGPTNHPNYSNRTIREDYDDLGLLKQKFIEEKEMNLKLEIDKRAEEYKIEENKKLTKKLIYFTENKLNKYLKIIDFIICFFILSDVILSVYTNMRFTSDEMDLNDRLVKERFYTDQHIENLRICIMVIVLIIEIMIVIKYQFKLKLMRSTLHASSRDTIFSTGLYKTMLIEMFVLIVFTPPELNGYFQGNMLFGYYTYSSDSFILLIKIFKLYYLAVIYSHISIWTSERAKEIAKENKATIGPNFAFKATLKKTPFFSIFILLALNLVLFSFMLRIFEYGFSQDAEDKIIANAKAIKNAQFSSYIDVIWVVLITMTTVGYGDIFPKTHMGRVVAFICSLAGMIIQSLLIVRLSGFIELTTDEKKAFNEIKHLDNQKNLELYSSNLIKSIFKLMQIKLSRKLEKKTK